MARKVREEERAARINEILDAAQTLIQTKGYEQMTIQDLLDALRISKGAFYYYFDSKQTLLEALVERTSEQVMAVLQPLVDDEQLSALPKLEAVFRTAGGWKTERMAFMVALMRVWYADENVLVREKMSRAIMGQLTILLDGIIARGIAEGTMSTDYPDLAGAIAVNLLYGMSDGVMPYLMQWDQLPDAYQRLSRCIAAYSGAIETVLGIERGTLHLVDPAIYDAWGAALSER